MIFRTQDVSTMSDRELNEKRVLALAKVLQLLVAVLVIVVVCGIFSEFAWQQAQSTHKLSKSNHVVLCANLRAHIEQNRHGSNTPWYVDRYKSNCEKPGDSPLLLP